PLRFGCLTQLVLIGGRNNKGTEYRERSGDEFRRTLPRLRRETVGKYARWAVPPVLAPTRVGRGLLERRNRCWRSAKSVGSKRCGPPRKGAGRSSCTRRFCVFGRAYDPRPDDRASSPRAAPRRLGRFPDRTSSLP